MKYIKWKEYPTDHAVRAYREGFFLEAIQVLHTFLEAKMRDLFMVSRHGNLSGGYREIWDVTQELGFNVLARALFASGKLTKKEYNQFQQFNSLRNKVVHKFFWEPYDKDYKGVPKKEYDQLFQVGMKLVEGVERKAGLLLHRKKGRTKQKRGQSPLQDWLPALDCRALKERSRGGYATQATVLPVG
jgi:hypothetical protein